MRQAPTDAESLLWKHLRNRQLNGLKFRRQHAIDRLIVDFCCIEAGLVIELDGPIHDEDPPRDETRDATLGERGFRVLRFRNEQLESNVQSVLAAIEAAAQ